MTLDLHCVCENAPIHERLRLKEDVFNLFETSKLGLLSYLVQVGYKLSPDFIVFAELFECSLNLKLNGQFHKILSIGNSDSNYKNFSWLTVYENLSKSLRLQISVLDFLSSYVLSLLKFKNIFLSVDDFEGSGVVS